MTDDYYEEPNLLVTTILSIPGRSDIVWSSSASCPMQTEPTLVSSIIRNTLTGHITHLTLEAEELLPKENK